jgi:spermidine/putrescine transport system substrate-binding protein
MKYLAILAFLCVGAMGLPGCKRDTTATSQAKAQRLNLFVWSEYVPQEVIDGFKKETGIDVKSENYSSNEAMLTKLASSPGQYDLIQPSEYMVEYLVKHDMLAPLDLSHLPNVANLLPEYRGMAHDPGLKYSVPYMSGTVGIVVNTDKVKEPIRGYQDVFQEKYKQRILALEDNRELVSCAMDVKGIPINEVTPENLAKVKPVLTEWVKLIKIYNSDDPKPQLFSGDVDLGIVYSGDAAKLLAQDKKFQYVLPIEGTHRFIDNLCIPKGAPNKEAAERFMDYILRPEVSKIISEKFPYTNPNGAARKLLSKEELANPASYPPQEVKLEIFHDIGKASGDIAALMTEVKNTAK